MLALSVLLGVQDRASHHLLLRSLRAFSEADPGSPRLSLGLAVVISPMPVMFQSVPLTLTKMLSKKMLSLSPM